MPRPARHGLVTAARLSARGGSASASTWSSPVVCPDPQASIVEGLARPGELCPSRPQVTRGFDGRETYHAKILWSRSKPRTFSDILELSEIRERVGKTASLILCADGGANSGVRMGPPPRGNISQTRLGNIEIRSETRVCSCGTFVVAQKAHRKPQRSYFRTGKPRG